METLSASRTAVDLIRGLHPAVLDDLGLDAALSGRAPRSPVPVKLRVDLPHRPPAACETVAYHVVSEALTNVARHAAASQVQLSVTHHADGAGERVRLVVADDGRGGAGERAHGGGGLRGLRQRRRLVHLLLSDYTVQVPPGVTVDARSSAGTSAGDIALEFDTSPDQVQASASAGDITIVV